jgi:hypothetical protein
VGGLFRLQGTLTGPIGPGKSPDLAVDYRIWNASLQHTNPPARFTDLNLHGQLRYNALKPEKARLAIDSLSGKLGGKPLAGKLVYENFLQPHLELAARGEVELAELQRLFPSALGNLNLSGTLFPDMQLAGAIADFETQRWNRVRTEGSLRLQNVAYRPQGTRRGLAQLNGTLEAQPAQLSTERLSGTWEGAPFLARVQVRNLVPYLVEPRQRLAVQLELNLDSLVWEESTPTGNSTNDSVPMINNVDCALTLQVGRIRYEQLVATNVRAEVNLTERGYTIGELRLQVLGGSARLQGNLGPRSWVATVQAQHIDLHQALQAFPQLADWLLVGQGLYGHLNTEFSFEARPVSGLNVEAASLRMAGTADVEAGKVRDFKVLSDMSAFLKLRRLQNLDFTECRTEFSIRNQAVTVRNLRMATSQYTLETDGTSTFAGGLDYQVRIGMPREQWRTEAQSTEVQTWIDDRPLDRGPMKLFLRITGTVDEPVFRLDGRATRQEIRQDLARERQELEEAARQEREEVFGNQSTETTEDWVEEAPREPNGLFRRRRRENP